MSDCRTMKTSGFLSRQGTYILVSLQLVPALATTHMCSSWIPTSKRSVQFNLPAACNWSSQSFMSCAYQACSFSLSCVDLAHLQPVIRLLSTGLLQTSEWLPS